MKTFKTICSPADNKICRACGTTYQLPFGWWLCTICSEKFIVKSIGVCEWRIDPRACNSCNGVGFVGVACEPNRFSPCWKCNPHGARVDRHLNKSLRELQTSLPWSTHYSSDFKASPVAHKDFAHAVLHVGKALGRLTELVDHCDHRRETADDPTLRKDYGKYLADLVICALRAANTFPGGVVDLQRAVEDRIREKNQ